MRIVCLSDSHGLHHALGDLPEGDVVVHAGDMARNGQSMPEVLEFLQWFRRLPHKHKILVAGNQDPLFQWQSDDLRAMMPWGIRYLQDEAVRINGVRFWGAPWQPWANNFAFNLPRGSALAAKWALIPENTQVLITHGPPAGIGDMVIDPPFAHLGCEALRDRIQALPALTVHICGHIHEGYGVVEDAQGRRFVNASICTVRDRPTNAPIVIDL